MTLPAEHVPETRLDEPGSTERPLRGIAKFGVLAGAGLAIACFYIVALLAMAVLALWIGCELAFAIILIRVGGVGWIKPFIARHLQLFLLFFRSAWLRKGTEFRVPVEESDAPTLFAFLRELSRRFDVAPPREVVLEMNASAWVMLKGMRQGADATTLGIGYDLIAGLTERELEAVVAHEMAHAKFVHRGYKRLINGGAARAVTLTGNLSAMLEAYRRAKQAFDIGEFFLRIFDRLTRVAVRWVAAYSRQDEFEADLGAAAMCGAAPLRSALIKIDSIVQKTSRISWTERAAQLQQSLGFSAWLADELAEPEATEDLEASVYDCYSTHPSLNDRLAALSGEDSAVAAGRPAIQLLADADALGKRLVVEIHRVMALEEQRATRDSQKWLRKIRRKGELSTRRQFGWVLFALAAVAAAVWVGERDMTWMWPTAGLFAFGAMFFSLGRYRGKGSLTIPSYESMQDALQRDVEEGMAELREKEIVLEIDGVLAGIAKKQKPAVLMPLANEALTRCDYLRAVVVSRKLQELDRNHPEVLIVAAIGYAGVGKKQMASDFLGTVLKRTGLHTPNLLWGAAWTLILLGDWASAEPMLEILRRGDPTRDTFMALLALCQSRCNKLQSATANARRAFDVFPSSKARIELLADLMIRAGHLVEAEKVLEGAGSAAETEPGLIESQIWLRLTRREFAAADQWVERLRKIGIAGHAYVSLGIMHESARRDAEATLFYAAALEQGFYPAAELGLARVAHHRGDKVQARQRALAALDLTRTLAKKAARPADVFHAVTRLLQHLQDPVASATAYICVLEPKRDLGMLTGHTLLVFAETESSAREHVLAVLNALRPADPPQLPEVVQIHRAPNDRQPIGAVRCGIQSVWR